MVHLYEPRFGRSIPVVAVIGANSGTELTDYIIPYSLLKQSGKADVFALSVDTGPVTMRPTSMRLEAQASAEEFDRRFPQGADHVIVPAVVNKNNDRLLEWIRAQHDKGATMVSICDGALVLANAGVLRGRRATAHWATADYRRDHHRDTEWLKDIRHVVDGRVISSAGISAAIPTSLALVELTRCCLGSPRRMDAIPQPGSPTTSNIRPLFNAIHSAGGCSKSVKTTQAVPGQYGAPQTKKPAISLGERRVP